LNLVFLGAPGVGKGTVAQRVEDEFGAKQVSTGDLIRAEIKAETELGKEIKAVAESGALVSDEIVAKLVEGKFASGDLDSGFILDGFPRTMEQGKLLDETLEKFSKKLDSVLYLTASEEIIIERLSGRRSCKQCGKVYHLKNIPPKEEGKCDICFGELFQREDDKPAVIKDRLRIYEESTAPLVEFYKKKSLLTEIDCSGTIDENMVKVREVLSGLSE